MKTVVLEVKSLEETLVDTMNAMSNCIVEQEDHVAFATPELLWKVLTAKRWQLIKALCGVGPVSIREAARRVGRDVKAVHADVHALLDAGILHSAVKGGVEFPYQAVKVDFILHAA